MTGLSWVLLLTAGLRIHEWGVVTLSGGGTGSVSCPEGSVEPGLEDKAPVVYFHGDPCTIALRVTVPGGSVTAAAPAPLSGGPGMEYAFWERLELVSEGVRNPWPGGVSYTWGDTWSGAGSLMVRQGPCLDGYVFYECALPQPGLLPYTVQGGNPALRMDCSDIPCLLVRRSDGRRECCAATLGSLASREAPVWDDRNVSERIRATLEEWSSEFLEPREFLAFWETWGGVISMPGEGTAWVVYRIPCRIVDDLCLLEAASETGMDVEIRRFHLAFLPVAVR
jgi:hypothetical protein